MTTVLENVIGPRPATGAPLAAEPHRAAPGSATETPSETYAIERDADLYYRVITRLANPGGTVAAEEVLGPLEEADEE